MLGAGLPADGRVMDPVSAAWKFIHDLSYHTMSHPRELEDSKLNDGVPLSKWLDVNGLEVSL